MKKWIDKFGEGGFLFISTLIVNIGNYGLNLLLGRFLGPEEFAAANILTTIVLVLSFTALGFQLATAKFVVSYTAEGLTEKVDSFITWIKKSALIFSVSISFLLILGQEVIRSYLHFESSGPLIMLFIAIPLYIDMSVSRGYFQGTNQFKKLAFTYIAEMIARLLVTGVLIYICLFMHQTWAIEAIALGFIAAFTAAAYFGTVKTFNIFRSSNFAHSRKVFLFLGVVAMYEFSQIIINNSDVILAKHFFENKEAGLYASLALIGRVVYFATWTIVTLLFPMVIEKEKKGEPHVYLFWSSVAVVFLFGAFITLGCLFFDTFIVSILFGEAYLSTAPLLWKYAVATTLFSCANVFVYYHMSLENYTPVFISLAIGLMQIIGIYFIHNSMEAIIMVQIILMATMFLTLSIYQRIYSIKKRKLEHKLKTSIILKTDIS